MHHLLLSLLIISTVLSTLGCSSAYGKQTLFASKTTIAAKIDGIADDKTWHGSAPLTVHDRVADIDIVIKAAYDDERIYLLATFPDATENRQHRSLVWNPQLNSYQSGPKREDVLVFKWNMSPHDNDLTLTSDRPYRADIWFWKAQRTDHAGYADDKMQFYTTTRNKKGQLTISKSGQVFYLQRIGDNGRSAYKPQLYTQFISQEVSKYQQQTPTASRADVRAKGHWENGIWTVEFSRALDTGHNDDVNLSPSNSYQFGISRYEIAGRKIEADSEQPLYGCGDISELLSLVFNPAQTQ